MQNPLSLVHASTYVCLAITLFCLWRIRVSPSEERNIRLLARVFGGVALLSLGGGIILPKLASPQGTSEGIVTDFHEVREYRSSHFEFRVNGQEPELRAYYFDKGFYFNDPLVSDGDRVDVSYLSWTNEIVRIREIAGHHTGLEFQEDLKPIGPWLLIAEGVLLILAGVGGKVSDIMARPDDDVDLRERLGGHARGSTPD
jgi:hypothetical protein